MGGTLFPTDNWIINSAVSLRHWKLHRHAVGDSRHHGARHQHSYLWRNFGDHEHHRRIACRWQLFQLFDATTYSGAFASSNLPALGSGLSWYLNDLTNYGTIRVVSAWTVAGLFNNNMVLQRGIPVPIWGTALPGQSVTVTFEQRQNKTTTAGTDRKWFVQLDAMAANTNSQSLTVTIAGSTTNTFTNVLVGEVWLAAGQSSMVLPLQSMTNAAAEIAAANYPLMRPLPVQHRQRRLHHADLADVSTPWAVCSPPPRPTGNRRVHLSLRAICSRTSTCQWGSSRAQSMERRRNPAPVLKAFEAVPELRRWRIRNWSSITRATWSSVLPPPACSTP